MTAPPRAYGTLRTKLGEIHDIVKSASLLGWDQQVLMPSRGSEARAYQLGICSEVVEPDALEQSAQALGEAIARNSPEALARTKRALWSALERVSR